MNNMNDQERELQKLLSYQKIFNVAKYLPHVITMCMVYMTCPGWAILILGAIYIFAEKQAGSFADIGGFIATCLSNAYAPSALIIAWEVTFSACLLIDYLLSKRIKELQEDDEN